jgi:hypothetical protein
MIHRFVLKIVCLVWRRAVYGHVCPCAVSNCVGTCDICVQLKWFWEWGRYILVWSNPRNWQCGRIKRTFLFLHQLFIVIIFHRYEFLFAGSRFDVDIIWYLYKCRNLSVCLVCEWTDDRADWFWMVYVSVFLCVSSWSVKRWSCPSSVYRSTE